MQGPYRSRPTPAVRSGALLFGGAMAALAVQSLTGTKILLGLEPLPPQLPGPAIWEWANTLVLLSGGAGIVIQRARGARAVVPAVMLGGLLTLWILLLHTRVLIAEPANGSLWSCLFETLALDGAAWVLAGIDSPSASEFGRDRGLAASGKTLGRLGFGAAMLVFSFLHLRYWKYILGVLPAWLPGPLYWNYFVAAAFGAAGLSLISGIQARWAGFWTGVMFLSWVVLLHLPTVLHQPQNRFESTSLLVALAMGGGAWIVAESYGKPRLPKSRP